MKNNIIRGLFKSAAAAVLFIFTPFAAAECDLCTLAAAGNVAEIRATLANRPAVNPGTDAVEVSINGRDRRNNTALLHAAKWARWDVVNLLLEDEHEPAVPDVSNNSGRTALMWAAHHGSEEMITLLLNKHKEHGGLERDFVDALMNNKTALDFALDNNRIWAAAALVLLEETELDMDFTLKYARSEFRASDELAAAELARVLITERDVDTAYKGENSILLYAARTGNEELARELLKDEANDRYLNNSQEPAWVVAVSLGHQGVYEQLSPDVDEVNKGRTALFLAAQYEHWDMVQALLDADASPEIADPKGQTPLMWAAQHGNVTAVIRLLNVPNGKNVVEAVRQRGGKTAFDLARESEPLEAGHIWSAVELIITGGAKEEWNVDDTLRYARGLSNLDEALELAKVVITSESVNTPYKNKPSILFHAAEAGDEDLAAVLVEDGLVKTFSEPAASEQAWVIALSLGHQNVFEYVYIENDKDGRGRTPLMLAVENKNLSMLKYLFSGYASGEIGADITDDSGRTPLMLAAERGYSGIISALLENERASSVKSIDILKDGDKAGDIAYNNGHIADAATLFIAEGRHIVWGAKYTFEYAAKHQITTLIRAIKDAEGVDTGYERATSILWYAALNNSITLAQELHKDGAKSVMNGKGEFAWRAAARKGWVDLFPYLLNGANEQDGNGRTPLFFAARFNQINAARYLLSDEREEKHSPVIPANNGDTTLIWAVRHNNGDMVTLLLDNVADEAKRKEFIARKVRNKTAVDWAVERSYYGMAADILLSGSSESVAAGWNAEKTLGYARGNNLTELMTVIIGAKSVNTRHNGHNSILLYAASENEPDLAEKLAEDGADKAVIDEDNGYTAWEIAARKGRTRVYPFVHDPDNIADSEGRTALYWALKKGHQHLAETIMLSVVENSDWLGQNAADNAGMAPLMLAAKQGYMNIVKDLLGLAGTDPSAAHPDNGKTAMSFAVEENHYQIAAEIGLHGGSSSIVSNWEAKADNTLGYAKDKKIIPLIRTIINANTNGASNGVNTSYERKDSILLYAADTDNIELAEALALDGADKSLGAEPAWVVAARAGRAGLFPAVHDPDNIQDAAGRTALYFALVSSNINFANKLLDGDYGAQHIVTVGIETPLMLAAQNGRTGIVSKLLDNADIDVARAHPNSNKTAVELAAEGGHYEIAADIALHGEPSIAASEWNAENTLRYAKNNGANNRIKIALITAIVGAKTSGNSNGVNIPYGGEDSILLYAALTNNLALAEALIADEVGTISLVKDDEGRTPFYLAVEHGHLEIVTLLVGGEYGGVDDAKTGGMTPLMAAAAGGYTTIVSILLESQNDADTTAVIGNSGKTAANFAEENGYYELAADIALHDSPSIASGWNAERILRYARDKEDTALITTVIAANVGGGTPYGDILFSAVKDAGSEDALTLASAVIADAEQAGNLSVVINSVNGGKTALALALELDKINLARLFLRHGAEYSSDLPGWRTYNYAGDLGETAKEEVRNILLENGGDAGGILLWAAKITVGVLPDAQALTLALSVIADMGGDAQATAAVGVIINTQDGAQKTALAHAGETRKRRLFELFLESGGDLQSSGMNGRNTYELVYGSGGPDITTYKYLTKSELKSELWESEKPAIVDDPDVDYLRHLLRKSVRNWPALLTALVLDGADVNRMVLNKPPEFKKEQGASALEVALIFPEQEAFHYLLSHGADPVSLRMPGAKTFKYGANNDANLVNSLIRSRGNVNIYYRYDRSILLYAAKHLPSSQATVLAAAVIADAREQGELRAIINRSGHKTALRYALEQSNRNLFDLLWDNGARAGISGVNTFAYAYQNRDTEGALIDALFEANGAVTIRFGGESSLFISAVNRSLLTLAQAVYADEKLLVLPAGGGSLAISIAAANKDEPMLNFLLTAHAPGWHPRSKRAFRYAAARLDDESEFASVVLHCLLSNNGALESGSCGGEASITDYAIVNRQLEFPGIIRGMSRTGRYAITTGNLALFRAVSNAPNANFIFPPGGTQPAIFHAISITSYALLEALIQDGASTTVTNSVGNIPWFAAAILGDTNLLPLLREEGKPGHTIEHVVRVKNNKELRREVLDDSRRSYTDYSAILSIAYNANNPNFIYGGEEDSIVLHAARINDFRLMQALINDNANLNPAHKNGARYTPLVLAAYHGSVKVVKLLITVLGANLRLSELINALYYAANSHLVEGPDPLNRTNTVIELLNGGGYSHRDLYCDVPIEKREHYYIRDVIRNHENCS